ncbi:MAG: pyridoxal phosphate-dependent aminotransferase [Proteobacteria bacterium]|nr:pyridoxal phosphate-dependent aminotransferase [Pseudomonadota bacterium]
MLKSPQSLKKLLAFSEFIERQEQTPETLSQEKRLAIVQKEWLLGNGLNILPDIGRLSTKDIDASTGSSAFAPPEAVEKDISNINSSQLPEYNNHLPQEDLVKAAGVYFRRIGVLDKDTSLKQDVYDKADEHDYFSVIGHGTTHLFTSALKSIIKTKGDVVIFPQPTYGLFLPPVLHLNGQVVSLPLNEKNRFKPDAHELRKLVLQTNDKLKDDYLKSISALTILLNGLFTEKAVKASEKKAILKLVNEVSTLAKEKNGQNFEALDKATSTLNQALSSLISNHFDGATKQTLQDSLHLPLCARVRGFFNINPHMPLGTICDQTDLNKLAEALIPFNDVVVIDDLTYYDLVMTPGLQVGTFAKSTLQARTLTLYSLSKQYALANVRAGIALGPKSLIEPICTDIFNTNNTPNIYSREAFYSIFRWDNNQRLQYLKETNEIYAFRRDFAMALIQGVPKKKSLEDKIKQALAELKITKEEQATLLQGIPGLKVQVTPNSGFFVTIDFSHYQGKYLGKVQLNQSRDFRNAFYCLSDVNTIPGELMYQFEKPVVRFSYSMTTKEILEGILRIKAVLELCQDKPFSQKEINALTNEPKKKGTQKKQNAHPAAKTQPAASPKELTHVYLPTFEKQKKKSKPLLEYAFSTINQKRKKGKRKIKAKKLIVM